MEQNETTNRKYPKSTRKFQCLGPCYQPGTKVIHPTYLDIVTDTAKPFCPVKEWEYVDETTGKKRELSTDTCFNPTKNTNLSNSELELNILIPYIDFDCEYFLKIYYNIFSFEDSIDWCDKNQQSPIDTQIRIMKSSLNAFGKHIDIVDHRFIDFFVMMLKKKFMSEIYDALYDYINVNVSKSEKIISITHPSSNTLKKTDHYLERMNYIIKMFVNEDYLHKFIMRYFMNRKSGWENISNHIVNMVNDFNDYIINKIRITLKS